MQNFIFKLQALMRGRYGTDELSITLLAFSVLLSLVSGFVFNWYIKLIMHLIAVVLLALAIFRTLSRNVEKRSAENQKFKPIFTAVTGWFKLTYKKLRDGRTHRYYKCPQCKAQLRVKNVKGKHTIRCPKCSNSFEKTIR